MKKIITMVGTSIINNFQNNQSQRKSTTPISQNLRELKSVIKDNIKNEPDTKKISSELKSLLKIIDHLKDNQFFVYLFCSDTNEGKLAAEIIKEIISERSDLQKNYKNKIDSIQIETIEGLQVKDEQKFKKKGLINLMNIVNQITNENWQDVIFNFTGGFKATIPFLTILAQINQCPIFYIFESTDVLIEIPYIPLDINWEVFKKNESLFFELEKDSIKEIPSDISFKKEVQSLLEIEDNLYGLNPLGVILWRRYKQNFEIINISEIVQKETESYDEPKKQIFKKSILELLRRLRQNPQDPDLNHRLENINFEPFKIFKHKEDNNQVRILYYEKTYQTVFYTYDYSLYIGDIAIGSKVHNSSNEYVNKFRNNFERIKDLKNYKSYRIQKE